MQIRPCLLFIVFVCLNASAFAQSEDAISYQIDSIKYEVCRPQLGDCFISYDFLFEKKGDSLILTKRDLDLGVMQPTFETTWIYDNDHRVVCRIENSLKNKTASRFQYEYLEGKDIKSRQQYQFINKGKISSQTDYQLFFDENQLDSTLLNRDGKITKTIFKYDELGRIRKSTGFKKLINGTFVKDGFYNTYFYHGEELSPYKIVFWHGQFNSSTDYEFELNKQNQITRFIKSTPNPSTKKKNIHSNASYFYDEQSRLVKINHTGENTIQTVNYFYDDNGDLKEYNNYTILENDTTDHVKHILQYDEVVNFYLSENKHALLLNTVGPWGITQPTYPHLLAYDLFDFSLKEKFDLKRLPVSYISYLKDKHTGKWLKKGSTQLFIRH